MFFQVDGKKKEGCMSKGFPGLSQVQKMGRGFTGGRRKANMVAANRILCLVKTSLCGPCPVQGVCVGGGVAGLIMLINKDNNRMLSTQAEAA